MFKFNDTIYILDLDKLMKWVSTSPTSERNMVSSITQVYPVMGDNEVNIPDELDYSTKEITEQKETLNDTMCNIRYDIIKIMINTIMSFDVNNEEEMSFQQKIAMNTLINKGIMIEKV